MKQSNYLKAFVAAVLLFTGVARAQVVVTATAGVMGPTLYPTLSAAFADINAGLPQGVIGVGIMSNITETGPCVLNASGAGAAIYTAVTIAPITDGVTISGPTVTGRGLIELNGADNVTIDGDNPNTGGVNRNLTITNTAANTVLRTSVIRLATSTLITNCDNVTIRNLNLNGSGTGRNISSVTSETLTFGIVASGAASTAAATTAPSALAAATTIASGQTMANLLINNNSVQTASRGIAINGAATTTAVGLVISNNIIGNATAGAVDQVWCIGITAQGSSNGIISGNVVYVEGYAQSSTVGKGIDVGTVNANGTFTIERNEIRRVINNDQTTWPAVGINIAGGTSSLIRNNFIYGLANNMVAGTGAYGEVYGVYGIRLAGGTGHSVIYNTVHMTGAIPGSTSTNITSCFVITLTSITGVTVRNNVFSNQMTGGNLTAQNMRHTCLLLPSGATNTMNMLINNNRYYQGGTVGSTIGENGFISGSSTDYLAVDFNAAVITPAANMRSYTSTLTVAGTNDDASRASTAAPPLTSVTNLHANLAAGNILDLEGVAFVIAGTTNDFDGDTRNATTPDIGGDEFNLTGCVSASGGTISPATQTTCAGQVVTMTSTGATSGGGISYQWKVGTTSGGPYINVSGGSGATTTSYTTGTLTAGTYYYVLQTTCSTGPVTGLSNQVTVTVNGLPTVGVTPTSATYCSGAAAVSLTASGALNYAWTPSTGLSAATGANVTANPTASTIYMVTGVDANGCFNTATTVITAAPTPTVSATATPSVVCSGGNSQLQATVAVPGYYIRPIPYTPTVGVGTNATTGDDAMSGAVTLPFTFNFYGVNYTQLFVCTNGFVQLGTSSGSTSVYGQALPTATAPTNIIAGVFSDLNSISAGQIVTYTTGSSPNRIFTIYYNNVAFYNNAASPFTTGNVNFQIQLFETSNIVEVHVGNVTGASTTTPNKTLGIEDATGANAMTPGGHNFLNWTAGTPEAWRFVPTTPITYGWTPATFLSSTTIANPMANAVTSTTAYSVLATTSSGCAATGTVTVTAGAVLTSSATITPATTVCAGTTVTFNGIAGGGGSPYSYSWTGPNSFTSTAQNPTLVTTVAASGVYTLVITDACAATSTASVTLTVNPLPVVAVSPTIATYCAGSSAVALTATGAPTYSWSPSAGLSATTGASVNASPAATTTYSVVGTDANGCTATATTAITSSFLPSGVAASSSASAVCVGDTIDLMGAATTTVTVLSQDFTSLGAWSVVSAPTSPAVSNWASVATPFNYIVGSLSFTNFSTTNGGNFYMCNSDAGGSGTTTNTQLVSPVFSTAGMTSANLTFEHIYQRWASGDINISVDISTDGGATWTALTTYTSDQGTVTGNAQATTNANISLAAYLNQSNLRIRYNYAAVWGYYWLVDNVQVSGNVTYAYDWTSSPVGFTSALQNPVDVIPAATTDYILTVTNVAGCASDDTVNVAVNALPTVTASATASAVCDGDPVTLNGGGATSYAWTGSVTDNVAFTPATTDTYTVTGTDANGCSDTASVMVTVNALPTVTASSTASAVCAGDLVTLNGGGATTYAWTGSVTDNAAFMPATTDTYTVTGTDGNGCSDTASVMVTVNALPVISASSSAAAVCIGDSVTVMGGGATSYTWTGSVTDNVPFVPATTDTYTVTGTDGNGCSDTASVMVAVNALPAVVANATSSSVCMGDSVTLSGSGAMSYMWSDSLVTDAVMFMPTSSATYTVTGTDANGCMNWDSVTVAVNSLPTVGASSSAAAVCAGDSVTVMGSGAVSYTWTGGATDNVPFAPATTDTYTVTGMDANGCTDTASVMVTVNALPTVTANVSQSTICTDDADLTLTGGSPAGGTWSGTSVTGTSFDPSIGAGTYVFTYTYTDGNGCTNSATDNILVDPCTGVATIDAVTGANVYPNPNEGQFTIDLGYLPSKVVNVEIMNSLGQVVQTFTMTSDRKQVDLGTYEGGVYMVRITDGNDVAVVRVVKQ